MLNQFFGEVILVEENLKVTFSVCPGVYFCTYCWTGLVDCTHRQSMSAVHQTPVQQYIRK